MTVSTQERASAREKYDQDGYVIFRNVLDAELVAEANDHVAWLQQRHPDVRPENLGHLYVKDDPFWVRLISDDRLLDIAELFIGPNIGLFASHYISKPPYSGKPVLWHQDGSLWPLDPVEVVTLWLAVDHSTPDNGCVRLVPGSHKGRFSEVLINDRVENVLGVEIPTEDFDESRAVDIVLAPGDVEVHHPTIVHGSNANTSPNRRCGLTIRYIPTSTRITSEEQPFPSAFLLRGEAGVNVYHPRPRYVAGEHFPFRGSEDWA
ncbi:phytanoyl-CoA dioxygenase family protein [Actinopolymorpha alba]|uniref:phytanoyl-CoA dioxygenase family protein n=1 Tax=Actinopolymorpha alba TaxID=533267 RepID=UPI000363FC76|nr:phytanoyl-CoA dioxygenase family protein [Actinopolymorpha alba]